MFFFLKSVALDSIIHRGEQKNGADWHRFSFYLSQLLIYPCHNHVEDDGVGAAAGDDEIGVSLIRLDEGVVHRLYRGEVLLQGLSSRPRDQTCIF